jgi:alkylated DNA nucleotide flippase Atl1
MNKNPHDTEKVACHRVVSSDGSLGGYAWGGKAKIKRLKGEGVEVRDGKIVDFEKKRFRFS